MPQPLVILTPPEARCVLSRLRGCDGATPPVTRLRSQAAILAPDPGDYSAALGVSEVKSPDDQFADSCLHDRLAVI